MKSRVIRRSSAVGRWDTAARFGRRPLWLVAGLVGLLGAAVLVSVSAAVHIVTAEAETGVVAGRAVKRSGNGSSGDGYVTFKVPRQYVAIGDSVASGDGVNYGWQWSPSAGGSWLRTGPASPVWEPATDMTPAVQSCRRSKQAYPNLVAAANGDTLYHAACSGAQIINGVLGARNFGSNVIGAAQLGYSQPTSAQVAPPSPAYDNFKPDVVTLTLGMNDIGFSEILRVCYVGTTCVTAQNDANVNQRLADFRVNLEAVLREIRLRGDAAGKRPAVVLTTYYDPFQADPNVQCNDTYIGLGNGLGANEITWIRSKMQAMNTHIRGAAATYPNAKVADLSQAFAGHEFCTADPWVYGISIWYEDVGNPAPFHPTPKGHEAIARIVAPIVGGL